jgi:hypothetical protein
MAKVLQTFLPAYRHRYRLSPEQASVCQSILQCQTAVLGGEYTQCTACGYGRPLYHSCGNRHCPRCKQQASEQWASKQLDALLPVTYYHLVFTLPHELNGWCQLHPKTLYTLFFKAVWQTLTQFSSRHKRLQGQLGVTSVLHTWGQTLQQHVHLHCLIPGIALKPGNKAIETTQSNYLYPINALKKVFRGKLVSLLREAYQQGQLFRITRANEVNRILDDVMRKVWSIYIKPYINNPQTVVNYLSRYTYRIAMSNYRLIKVDQQCVYFHWKDYADNNRKKIMTLDGVEFVRRFLMHVLPRGFMRIRHFGFLANCIRQVRVRLLRQLLSLAGLGQRVMQTIKPVKWVNAPCLCPLCHEGTMIALYQISSWKERRRLITYNR